MVQHRDHGAAVLGTAERARDGALALPGTLLVTALTAAIGGQGGYYRQMQVVVAVLLALAVGAALRNLGSGALLRDARPLVLPATALAVWAVVRAATQRDVPSALGVVALLAGVLVVALVARTSDQAERETLSVALVVLGVIAAVTCWVGVAWRIPPLALQDQRLWRAAGTFTYANAAAGLLAPLTLATLARLVMPDRTRAAPGPALVRASAVLLVVGLGATLSRGGVLALVIGLGVLAVAGSPSRVAAAVWAPFAGAGLALVALAPSMPADRPPSPALAGAGLAAGLAMAVLGPGVARRHRVAVLAAVLVPLALGSAAVVATGVEVAAPRLTLASSDRVQQVRVAAAMLERAPWVGTGPGQGTLVWSDDQGRTLVGRYVHNEYLQVAVELGLIGAVLLLALLAGAAQLLRRSPLRPSPLWLAAVAGLSAFAAHSGVEFLWHLPAIPLSMALLWGVAVPPVQEREPT